MRPFISEYVPDNREYEELFDVLEYLMALVYWEDDGSWAPLGSFLWRQWGDFGCGIQPRLTNSYRGYRLRLALVTAF